MHFSRLRLQLTFELLCLYDKVKASFATVFICGTHIAQYQLCFAYGLQNPLKPEVAG